MYRFNLIRTFHVTLKNFLPGYWGEDRRQISRVQPGEGWWLPGLHHPAERGPALGELAHLLYSTSFPAADSLSMPGFATAVKCGGVATPLPLFL